MPGPAASGPGDIVADPRLVESGTMYAADWYKLRDDSPAVDKALTLFQVTRDFLGRPRGTVPDMGAIEK